MIKASIGTYEVAFTFRHTRDTNFEVKPGKVITDVTSCLLTINGEQFDALAACVQGDSFNKRVGRKIALQRALAAAQVPREVRREVWNAYWSYTR